MASLKVNKDGRVITRPTRGRAMTRGQARPPIMDCLPIEIITEIVASLVSTSPIDLFSYKQTCKILHEISEEKRVLQQVMIDGDLEWRLRNRVKAKSFVERCRNDDNPHALYRVGMVQYFRQLMVVEGLKNLEKAVSQQHIESIYAISLILLCSGDDEYRNKGLSALLDLMNTIKGQGIVQLRRKLKDIMHSLRWQYKKGEENGVEPVIVNPKIDCAMGNLHEIIGDLGRYSYEDGKVEDKVVCVSCKCAREVDFFCKLVKQVYN